jgi:large subunit ribosomal protein LP1
MSTAELATSYAALILADDGVDITVRSSPSLTENSLLTSPGRQAHNTNQSRRCQRRRTNLGLFIRKGAPRSTNSKDWANTIKALEGKDVKDMLLNVGSGGGAAAPAAGGAAAGGTAGAAAEDAPKEEEKKEEGKNTRAPQAWLWLTFDTEKEESDEDMGFGLFD